MRMSKRGGIISGVIMLFWVTIAVIIILAIFLLTASIFRHFVDVESGVKTVKTIDIDSYMVEFKAMFEDESEVGVNTNNAGCGVDFSTCEVLDAPCSCPTFGDLVDLKEGKDYEPEVCKSGEYCHYGADGCTDEMHLASITRCKESLGEKFVQAPVCEVDISTCEVLSAPCSCPTFGALYEMKSGKEVVLETCLSGEYCQYGVDGCTDEMHTKSISDCKDSLGEKFVQAPDCKIDSDNAVLNAPCSCPTFGGLSGLEDDEDIAVETCLAGEYCYRGEVGCNDKKK